jgi:cell division septal protein FtsQ
MKAQRTHPTATTAGRKPSAVVRRKHPSTAPMVEGEKTFVAAEPQEAAPLQHTASARRAVQTPGMESKGSRLKTPAVLSQASLNATAERPPESRRKRRLARTMRRFESAIDRLPHPPLRRRSNTAQPARLLPGWLAWLTLLATVLFVLAGALVYLMTDPSWFVYRENVQIRGLSYLDADEIYAASGVDSWHGLWLRPQTIRNRLLQQPFVQGATVAVTWPNQVAITIEEQQPVALWVTNAATLWLMPNGEALAVQNDQHNNLPQIIDPQGEAQAVTNPSRPAVDKLLLDSALSLWANVPEMSQLRYNRDYGLNFNLPGSLTWVYWGNGEEIERKFTNLTAVRQLIESGEAKPQIIDLRFERPYFH